MQLTVNHHSYFQLSQKLVCAENSPIHKIDISYIILNEGTKSGLELTKYSDLYEIIVHKSFTH